MNGNQKKKALFSRFDYFLIWGNGLPYKDEIILEIRKNPGFKIVSFIRHKTGNIKKLVREVYSFDYAPFYHLKEKTHYLLTTKPEILVIVVKNYFPEETYSGKDGFRHIESLSIKKLKEGLRDKFNERKSNRRTENHVVHASDNQDQTHRLLKYLGVNEGIHYYNKRPNPVLDCPHFIEPFSKFQLLNMNISQLYCRTLTGDPWKPQTRVIKIEESPQYKCLEGEENGYGDYLNKYLGTGLKADYSLDKLTTLKQDFKYLNGQHSNKYILVKKDRSNKNIILDGLHRAAIIKHHGVKHCPVAMITC